MSFLAELSCIITCMCKNHGCIFVSDIYFLFPKESSKLSKTISNNFKIKLFSNRTLWWILKSGTKIDFLMVLVSEVIGINNCPWWKWLNTIPVINTGYWWVSCYSAYSLECWTFKLVFVYWSFIVFAMILSVCFRLTLNICLVYFASLFYISLQHL